MKVLLKALVFGVLISGAISLVGDTVGQGTDLLVFWKAANDFFAGASLYQLNKIQTEGMVFKYPPWVVPLIIPFHWLSFEGVKVAWGIFQVLCLSYCVWSLKKLTQIRWEFLFLLLFSYWGIWVVHMLDGQVALPMLAFTLLSLQLNSRILDAASVVMLTAKVFTVFPWIMGLKRLLKKTTVLILAFFVFGATAIVAHQTEQGSYQKTLSGWMDAARSGASQLPTGVTRGKRNPSLSILICELAHVPEDDTKTEVFISIVLFLIGGGALFFFARNMDDFERWALAFAYTPIAHPLPWLHLFSWTFPLAVFVLQEWVRGKRRVSTGIPLFLGLSMITLSNAPGIESLEMRFQFYASKSVGTLLLIATYIYLKRKNHEQPPTRPTEFISSDPHHQ